MIGRYLNSGAVKICNRLFKVYIIFHFFLKLETNTDYKKSMIEEVFLWNWKMFSKKESRNCCSRKGFPSTPWLPGWEWTARPSRISYMGKAAIQRSALFFCSVLPFNWRYPNSLRQKNLKIRNWKRWTQAAPGQERRRTAEGIRKLQFC